MEKKKRKKRNLFSELVSLPKGHGIKLGIVEQKKKKRKTC